MISEEAAVLPNSYPWKNLLTQDQSKVILDSEIQSMFSVSVKKSGHLIALFSIISGQ